MASNRTLVIDSSIQSGGSNSQFRLQCNPAINNVTRIKLVFASIPTLSNSTVPYFIIRINEFASRVQGTTSDQARGSFIVPITAASGFRNIHQSQDDFASVASGNGDSIGELNISVLTPDGTVADDAGSVLLLFQLE
jgi:hypothetical protein